jgi:hypothetical protein
MSRHHVSSKYTELERSISKKSNIFVYFNLRHANGRSNKLFIQKFNIHLCRISMCKIRRKYYLEQLKL